MQWTAEDKMLLRSFRLKTILFIIWKRSAWYHICRKKSRKSV